VSLEGQDRGRLDTLERVLETLEARAYLAPSGQGRAFYTHAGNASVSHEWETPVVLLEALHTVFGRFDLDPCAPRRTRTRVKARRHLTAGDDGLSTPWRGVVFVNPPYGRELARWVAKARRKVELGHAKMVVTLLPARPDTAYWHDQVAGRAVVYFLRGRLRFGDGKQSAPFLTRAA
jgi:phage N-6-adenine-methyltransferase